MTTSKKTETGGPKKAIEVWASEKKTPAWDFLLAKVAIWGNVQGVEVDEAAFEAGLAAAQNTQMKGY
jgi:hypothetical protein